MSAWAKLPAIQGRAYCSHGCGSRDEHAPMDAVVHPGFGGVSFTRDGHHGGSDLEYDASATFADYEAVAAADPDHDWRIRIDGPLADYTYQRHGEAMWALVEQGQGFA